MMQELTPKEEYDLLTSGEEVATFGLQCKPVKDMHDGHLNLIGEIQETLPDATTCAKIFTLGFGGSSGRHAISRPDRRYKREKGEARKLKKWLNDAGVDYIVQRDVSELDAFKEDGAAWAAAWKLPIHNLKFGKGFTGVKTKAKNMWKEWEFNTSDGFTHDDEALSNLVALFHPANDINFKHYFTSDKDLWVAASRKFMTEKWSDRKVHIVPHMTRFNGVPLSSSDINRHHRKARVPKKWWTRKNVTKIQPKWLEGKAYYAWNFETKGKDITLTKII